MRRARQDGFALVTVMVATAVMMLLGVALFSLMEGQRRDSGHEEHREAGFQLAESALASQGFLLTMSWPSSAATALPATCGPASTAAGCPNAAELARSETASGPADWATEVRDNGTGAPLDYTDAVRTQPSWDANHDGAVWVRARAEVAGRPTALVTLYSLNRHTATLARNVITAGHFRTSNEGNKVIVDTLGVAGEPSTVAVRCASAADPACLDYRVPVQVGPGTPVTGWQGGSAMSPDALNGLRMRARLAGTYYASGCPATPSGAVVFVESGTCFYTGTTVANSAESPGIFIVANGSVEFTGNVVYYGIVYGANLSGSSNIIVTAHGNALVQGAITVDGNGGVQGGSSKENVVYDPTGLDIDFFGAAVPGKNTWRQVPA